MHERALALPPGVQLIERGWLSANNVVFLGPDGGAVVDTGYATHAGQTVALVEQALGVQPLSLLVNTHLHSDHCGGNAALQARYPGLHTTIPPGSAPAVAVWDEGQLTYAATGQDCPRFRVDATLTPGSTVTLGRQSWDIHAAPGHDPDAVLLFEPASGCLISGDALWRNGFGVVFPELIAAEGFADVGRTLDLIERLRPRVVIPGHGAAFADVDAALAVARARLANFMRDPARHALHAAKVLLKFKILEWQVASQAQILAWVQSTDYLTRIRDSHFASLTNPDWVEYLLDSLAHAQAITRHGDRIHDR